MTRQQTKQTDKRTLMAAASFLTFYFLSSTPSLVQAATSCSSLPRSAAFLQVRILDPEPVLDHTRPAAWLFRLKQQQSPSRFSEPVSGRLTHTLGLTFAEISTEMSVRGIVSSSRDDSCFVVTNIYVVFGLRRHVVFIAEEIPRQSCLWQDIYQHEMRHVAVNRHSVTNVGKLFMAQMANIAHRGIVGRGPNPDAARQAAIHDLRFVVSQFLQFLDQHMTQGHDAIDTPEEYERARRACEGELNALLRGFRPH